MLDLFAAWVIAVACTIPCISIVSFWQEWRIIQNKQHGEEVSADVS